METAMQMKAGCPECNGMGCPECDHTGSVPYVQRPLKDAYWQELLHRFQQEERLAGYAFEELNELRNRSWTYEEILEDVESVLALLMSEAELSPEQRERITSVQHRITNVEGRFKDGLIVKEDLDGA